MITREVLLRGLLGVAGLAFIGPVVACSSEGKGGAATCPALGAAQKTEPHVLAKDAQDSAFLELTSDDSHVYWMTYDADHNTGQISSVSKKGGDSQLVLSFDSNGDGLRAGKGDELYLTHRGALWAVPKEGGDPRVITETLPNPVWGAFEVDDKYAYQLAGDEGCAIRQGTSIVRVALDSGEIKPLATGLAHDDDCGPADLAIDDDSIFYAVPGGRFGDPNAGKIFTLPKDGGTPKLLATGAVKPQTIALSETHVYFQYEPGVDYYDRSDYFGIARVAKTGGPVEFLTESCYYGSNFQLTTESLLVEDLSGFIELSPDGTPLGQWARPFESRQLLGSLAAPEYLLDNDGLFLFVGPDLAELGRPRK